MGARVESKGLFLTAQSGATPAPAVLLPARSGLRERGEAGLRVSILLKPLPLNKTRLMFEKRGSALSGGQLFHCTVMSRQLLGPGVMFPLSASSPNLRAQSLLNDGT